MDRRRGVQQVFAAVLLLGGLVCAVPAAGGLYVPLRVAERSGVARSGQVAQSGVPLPRAAQVLGLQGLAIIEAGSGIAVDADFVVTARWGGAPDDPTRPIKWLLVSFRASVPANGVATYALVDYRPSPPAARVTLDASREDYWVVDTGVAQFEVSTSGLDLFRRVTLGGVELVSPGSGSGPYYSLQGTTYRAAQATGGKGTLRLFRAGVNSQTLTMRAAGSHRTVDNRDDEDLDYVTFLTFTAGASQVRIQHVVQNNRSWVALENNADFRQVGAPHSVSADEIGIRLKLNTGSAPTYRLSAGPDGADYAGPLASPVSVYQDNSGDDNWDQWVFRRTEGNDGTAEVDAPLFGPQAYVRLGWRGFEVKEGPTILGRGDKMNGYLDIDGPLGGLTVAVRNFWQNYPKALRATPSGEVQIALFPEEFRARHSLRVGEQKTHDILMYFHLPAATDVEAEGLGFAHPLLAVAEPSWYAQVCRVVPAVSTDSEAAYRFDPVPGNPSALCPQPTVDGPEWDRFMAKHLEGPGADDDSCEPGQHGYAFSGLDEAIPAAQMYSWLDFGDLPIDFEDEAACGGAPMRSITGQYGWKYDGDYGLLLNFLRSGDSRFLDYGLAAAEHVADVDILHHGVQSGRGISDFRDGGMFGHEQHDDNGDRNPHRNGNPAACGGAGWNGTPTADMIYGAGAMALGYYLTGEPQLAQSLGDLAEWTAYMVGHWGVEDSRKAGNALRTLAWAYAFTGSESYAAAADQVVAGSPYFHSPMPSGLLQELGADALGLYVSFLHEKEDTRLDDQLAFTAGGPTAFNDYISDVERADVHAWAALLLNTGKADSLRKAADCFANGVTNPAWADASFGLSRVFQVKEWMFALRGSQVYQLAVYDAKGGPKFAPTPSPVAPTGGASSQNTPPTARIAGGEAAVTPSAQPVLFDGSASTDPESPASGLSYFWDFGDGTSATGMTASHVFPESGVRTVRLYVGDGESVGLETQTITVVFVNHPPTANAGEDHPVPVGVAAPFDGGASSDPDGQALSWRWDFGDGQTAEGARATHAFASPGTYRVKLTVSDGELEAEDTLDITVTLVSGVAVTQTFQDGVDGYAGTLDAQLWSRFPTANYGALEYWLVGRQDSPELNALLRFDLSAIPAGSRIEGATLTLTVSAGDGNDSNWEGAAPEIHIHPATTAWTEGTGVCCDSSGATWAAFDGVRGWSSPGGDFDLDPRAGFFGSLTVGAAVSADVTALVQNWVLGSPNHGFLLTGAPDKPYWNQAVYSRQSPSGPSRPRLQATWRPPAVGGVVRGDANGDGQLGKNDLDFLFECLYADGPAPATLCAGDANHDGQIDARDLFFLVNHLCSGGPAPSACTAPDQLSPTR